MKSRFPTREHRVGPSFRLLYLEDEAGPNSLIEGALSTRGHRVCGIQSAEEMHLLLDHEPFDAVLVDGESRPSLVRETAEKLRVLEHATGRRIPMVSLVRKDSTRESVEQIENQAGTEFSLPPTPPRRNGKRPMSDLLDKDEILARVDGDVELLGELVEIFLEDCPRLMKEIEEAVTSNNTEALERSAHAFKGSVGNFTTKTPFEAAFTLETMGRNGDLDGANDALAKLKTELERLKPELSQIKDENPT